MLPEIENREALVYDMAARSQEMMISEVVGRIDSIGEYRYTYSRQGYPDYEGKENPTELGRIKRRYL